MARLSLKVFKKVLASNLQSVHHATDMGEQPETLAELREEILYQLSNANEPVVITFYNREATQELLASITDGIEGTRELNRKAMK